MISLYFYRPFSPISRLVGWWTDSSWVHVAIRHEIEDVPVVTEATNCHGVVVRRSDAARPPDAIIPIPWINSAAATVYLSRYWGGNYGWKDVCGFVTGTNKDYGGTHCAELVAKLCLIAIPCVTDADDYTYEPLKTLFTSKVPNRVSPADIAKALRLPS